MITVTKHFCFLVLALLNNLRLAYFSKSTPQVMLFTFSWKDYKDSVYTHTLRKIMFTQMSHQDYITTGRKYFSLYDYTRLLVSNVEQNSFHNARRPLKASYQFQITYIRWIWKLTSVNTSYRIFNTLKLKDFFLIKMKMFINYRFWFSAILTERDKYLYW